MFCPNCGNENSREQRFCRICGLRLDSILEVVQAELQESKQVIRRPPLNFRSIFLTAWYYGFFLIALGLVIITFGKKIVGEQVIADIGSVMSFLGLALLIARGILLLKAQNNYRYYGPAKADATKELTPLLEAKEQPSVTEFTTRNFDPAYAERKKPDSSATQPRS